MLAFKKNMGSIDRVIRFLVGVILIAVGFFKQEVIGDTLYAILLGIFGIINLGSSFMSYCPFYHLADVDTTKTKQDSL
ncbi:MAG: DUF2892 domain-containing protein [Nitrospirota bacterium]|nr:DUF2892 domain-containing protein [Nitrospirota bacterium]